MRVLAILAALPLLLAAAGCNLIAAAAVVATPERTIRADYVLAGKRVAVLVWADRSVRTDWPLLTQDVGNGLQAQLVRLRDEGKQKQLLETTFPVAPNRLVDFMSRHPELETVPVAEFAPRFRTDVLIYVELESFATQSPLARQLSLGQAIVTLRVYDIAGNTATLAFEENGVAVQYPDHAPPEGVLVDNTTAFYRGTVKNLTEELALRFVDHPEE